MALPERDCWFCLPAFSHWTSDAVGVVLDNGYIVAADRGCARRICAPDRIVDVTMVTDLNGARS